MSSAAVLAVPAPPPPPDPSGHPGWDYIVSTMTDYAGNVWDLTAPERGIFLRRGGVRGLGMPKVQHYRDRLATLPGVRWRGYSVQEREVGWPLYVFHDGSTAEYVARDEALWQAFAPSRLVRWTVRVPGVSTRHLDLRFDDDGDWAPEMDPTFYGWAQYDLRATAESPFWQGEPIVRTFDKSEPASFFGGLTPGSPIVQISRGATLSSASIPNPGDEPGFPVVVLRGPFSSAEVTIDGRVIEVPFSMAEGEHLTIDGRPTVRSAIDHTGADRYEDLGEIAWGTVQPGAQVPIGLVMNGDGAASAQISLTPQYHRAWGTR